MEVCLYNTASGENLHRPLDGRSTVARVRDWVEGLRALSDAAHRVTVHTTTEIGGLPDGWTVIRCAPLTQASLATVLAHATGGPDTEILFSFLDRPFLNTRLTARIVARHREYRAEYTFADGYPSGLAPELISGRAVAHLQALADDAIPVDRLGVFPIVQKDINRLDVETELSAVDQRLLRIELAVDDPADLMLCERMAPGAPVDIDAWADHVESRRVMHRTVPRFVSLQVIEREVQRLAYSPYPLMRADVLESGRIMDAAQFGQLIDQVGSFCPRAVVHLSLWGEVALHPQAVQLVRLVLAQPGLRVLVETSGVGWSLQAREELFAIDDERCVLIVGLDSNDRAVYESVRGAGYEEAQRFATAAVQHLPRRTYIQAIRSQLTEPSLDSFYREWRAKEAHVIVEKYDHFCGRLPQRKVGDISPLDRFPCWHLQRDLCVMVDGTVPLCREDLDAQSAAGNVFSDGLEAIWAAGEQRFAAHTGGRYEGICGVCDEYYTFNF